MVWLIRLAFYFIPLFTYSNTVNSVELNKEEDMIFDFIDLDNDDKISSLEIEQSVNLMLQLIDLNRDGYISKLELGELKNIIESLK